MTNTTKPKKKTAYKKLNIPFSKELYTSLKEMAERENRSMTSQIVYILERNSIQEEKK
jgi:hypothetical protein